MITCEVNFWGKLFTSLKRIYLDGESVSTEINNQTHVYSLRSMSAPPVLIQGLFGAKLILSFNSQRQVYLFLKSTDLLELHGQILKVVADNADEILSSVFDSFQKEAKNRFLRDSKVSTLQDQIEDSVGLYSPLYSVISDRSKQYVSELEKYRPLENHVEELRSDYEKGRSELRSNFFDSVESNPLTDQQRLAVIRENDRNLILAAAGTGKTSVMVAKALDLIQSEFASPEELLILAYNKAATVELKERMEKRASSIGLDSSDLPEINTFHALGRKILVESGIKPSMSKFVEDPLELKIWASNWFSEKMISDPSFMKNFIDLMYIPVNVFDFKTKEEYDRYICDNEYRTLQGEVVKGYQELLIANWLFSNNIPYEYEAQYVTKRRIEVEFDYRPDFHLSGTNIYLEHFGIDRNGGTAPWIDKVDYNEKIRSKRELHKENETVLIETYHYDWTEDNLENRLSELMDELGIEKSSKSTQELFENLNEKRVLEGVIDRYLKCLNAIRVERLDRASILSRLNEYGVPNADKYQVLLCDLQDAYISVLRDHREIDFDDMIIRATEEVDKGEFKPSWRYILVDEFQDISMARMQLIQSLVSHGPDPILTVVGDDWQSIYRFSGGKLELTTRFDELVGSHSMTKLEKTFRYNSSIAETAGTFIMENPEQYRKDVVTAEVSNTPQVFLLDSKIGNKSELEERTCQIIAKILANEPKAKIAVLARYNYLLSNTRDRVRDKKISGDIKYWTFHSSKGLEADHCILIGFFQGKTGFPNENKEETVVEALLPSLDTFNHSEERRLLYVAITRARKKCYILGDPTAPSEFIIELLSPKYNLHIGSKTFEEQYRKIFKCHLCTPGYYRLLDSKFGPFYSCSSGSSCRSKPRICDKCGSPSLDQRGVSVCNNVNCRHEMKICSVCGRPMKLRDGKYGKFWGCSGFGLSEDSCKHTERIQ